MYALAPNLCHFCKWFPNSPVAQTHNPELKFNSFYLSHIPRVSKSCYLHFRYPDVFHRRFYNPHNAHLHRLLPAVL